MRRATASVSFRTQVVSRTNWRDSGTNRAAGSNFYTR